MIRNRNKKKFYIKKFLVLLLIVSTLLFSYPQKTKAAWIVGLDPIIRTALDTLWKNIESIIVNGLKASAIKIINAQVDKHIGGMKGGGIITNWRIYLIDNSKNKASTYLNDYLSQATKGRGNGSGYSTEGYNYEKKLKVIGEKQKNEINTVQANEYEGNPSQMFSSGNFKNLGVYTSGNNNPWAFKANADGVYRKAYNEEKEIAGRKSVAYQGVSETTTKDGNSITRPGSLNMQMIANIEDIPNKILAKADSIGEVVSAIVVQALTRSFQRGFESMQQKYETKLSS